jgi:hypothetical protein
MDEFDIYESRTTTNQKVRGSSPFGCTTFCGHWKSLIVACAMNSMITIRVNQMNLANGLLIECLIPIGDADGF